jgi:hypothetical protein
MTSTNTTSTEPRNGGCQCGAIRYVLHDQPIALTACHCRECQRQSGSAFGLSLIVLETNFELLRGEVAVFERPADSGQKVRCAFCRDCGNRIYHQPDWGAPVVNVKAGTLDDTSGLKPTIHTWTREKQPWVPIPADALQFESQPTAEERAAMAERLRR